MQFLRLDQLVPSRLQPGNIYVRRDPNTPNQANAQIVLLDHGLYETIGTQEREALCQLWKAIVLKDEAKMKKYSAVLGVQGECVDPLSIHPKEDSLSSISFRLEKDFLTFALMLSMRPIHRPVHEMAVLPEVWDKMTPEEQEAARAQGKLRAPVSETMIELRSTSLF